MPQAYYIALLPSNPIRLKVRALKQHMADQYHTDAALRSPAHLTLHPPFELDAETYPTFEKIMKDFCQQQKSFSIQLNDFGSFPANRVIYIQAEMNNLLVELRENLISTLNRELGISHPSFKHQTFHPHITIALYNLSAEYYPLAWQEFEHQAFQESFEVNSLAVLKKRDNTWEVFQQYAFR